MKADSALAALASARRVYDRLDWWQRDDWRESDLWSFASAGDTCDGALLIVPSDLDAHQRLADTQAHTAWLRWCALADGRSASPVMRALFASALAWVRAAKLASVWAIADATDWIAPYLADAGFVRVDRMLTYQIAADACSRWPVRHSADGVVRLVEPGTLDEVVALDAMTFDEPWRYGNLLYRAHAQCAVFAVAEVNSVVAGYICAAFDKEGERSHIVRLAVAQEMRGRGIGTALLAYAAQESRALGAATITLNTQRSNIDSQRLYGQLGFHQLIEQPYVLRLDVNESVKTRGAGA